MNRALKKTGAVSPVALGSHNGLWSVNLAASLEEVLAPGYFNDLAGRVLEGDRLMLACGPEGDRAFGDAVVVTAVEQQAGEPGQVVVHLLASTRPLRSTRKAA